VAATQQEPVVLVTGATDGIGKETAIGLARRGARVIVHGRTPERVHRVVEDVKKQAAASWVGHLVADLSSLAEVRAMAQSLPSVSGRLDVLVNNAGCFMREREPSHDGFELTFAVNYLSRFVLTHLLIPFLRESESGRIVNVSSVAHQRCKLDWQNLQSEKIFDDYNAYATSQLAIVLMTVEIARRLGRQNSIRCNALHPGVVSTKLLKTGFGIQGPDSLEKGAATSIHLALSEQGGQLTGAYFQDGVPARAHPLAGDPLTSSKFYEMTANMVNVPGLPRPGARRPTH